MGRELRAREAAEAAEARSEAARRGWETRRREAEAFERIGRAARREPYREPAPVVRAPRLPELQPLADVGRKEAEHLRDLAREEWVKVAESTSRREAEIHRMKAHSLEYSAQRAERGAIAADRAGVVMADPVMVRGGHFKWRDARGRFVEDGTPGARKELHVKTSLGELGKRATPLLRALREAAERGQSWDKLGGNYYRRAVALGLVG